MAHEDEHDDEADHRGIPRCPRCGSVLGVGLLELPDEDEPETLLLVDCPREDFRGTLTHQHIITVLTAAVREQLGF